MVEVRQDDVQLPKDQAEGARITPPLAAEREQDVGNGQRESDAGTVVERPRARE